MAIISIPTSLGGVSIPGQIGQTLRGPLASLYQGNGVETLKYPADLATDPTKSHYVQFSVKEVVPADYTSSVGVDKRQNVQVISNAISEVEKGLGALGVSTDMTQSIKDGVSISPKRFLPRAVISLYMPDTLQAHYSASWSDFDLASIGGSTIRNIDQIAGNISDTIRSKGSLINALSSDPAVTQLVTENSLVKGALGKIGVDSGALGKILLNAQGYSVNPQVQLLFNQVSLRDFNLSFTFTPKSRDESTEVQKIIKMFKYHFAPALQKGKETSSNSMFLEAPSVFNINFNINGMENKYLPKYGDCALVDIDVNYAPNGWASYEDGAPVQTTLSLSFKEMEIVDKDRINKEKLR
jgi:hypothetical protein